MRVRDAVYDESKDSCLGLFINKISPTHSPDFGIKGNIWGMDIKKTWEKHPCLSHSLAFALPFTKISNSASPRQLCIICLSMQRKLSSFWEDTIVAYGYNTPSMDASLRYLLVKSKLRSSTVEDSVQKTSFPYSM